MESSGKTTLWRGLLILVVVAVGCGLPAAATPLPWTIENVQLVLPGSADVYTLTGSFTLDVSNGHLT
ncbi:MAG TPA: hypothetical protein VFP94_08935, partial [Terriglobales bacterium]|nr:hypothetical protein [Terriglobales bacterium]